MDELDHSINDCDSVLVDPSNAVKRRTKSKYLSRGAGRWTDSERRTFLVGLQRFGRGKWKEIATLIPTRSTIQVKTHAQMVMKRVAAGDDAFAEYYLELLESPSLQIGETKVVVKNEPVSTTSRRQHVAVAESNDGLSLMDQEAAQILYQMAH